MVHFPSTYHTSCQVLFLWRRAGVSVVSSGASLNISIADEAYQNKREKNMLSIKAVAFCCKVMTAGGTSGRSARWDVPSVIQASLLYVRAPGSMWKGDIPQVSALTLEYRRKQAQLLKCHCLSCPCTRVTTSSASGCPLLLAAAGMQIWHSIPMSMRKQELCKKERWRKCRDFSSSFSEAVPLSCGWGKLVFSSWRIKEDWTWRPRRWRQTAGSAVPGVDKHGSKLQVLGITVKKSDSQFPGSFRQIPGCLPTVNAGPQGALWQRGRSAREMQSKCSQWMATCSTRGTLETSTRRAEDVLIWQVLFFGVWFLLTWINDHLLH